MELIIQYNGENIAKFQPEEKIEDLINYLDIAKDDLDNIKVIPNVDDTKVDIKESIVEDVPEKEWTIWSSSDFGEATEQIPLVKIIAKEDGELEAVAVGDDDFDQEGYKTAVSSLKYSAGKPTKDRLIRVDKSLNHSDPYLSTELSRYAIKANRGTKKKDIKDIISKDAKDVNFDEKYLTTLANQILLFNRDELKAAANRKSTTEEDLANLFKDFTGVNYYTEEIEDKEQYEYLLDLLGRSPDKYDDTYVSPSENEYVMSLKDLTEDLIEKVILKSDPDFYNK